MTRIPGGTIKSIQRGATTLTGTSATATVTAVNTAKSHLIFLGAKGASQYWNSACPTIVLTNSTTITFTRDTVSADTQISWELVEYW